MPHEPRFDHSGYLGCVEPRIWRRSVEMSVLALRPISDTFDTIAVRGVSGLLIGGAVASELGKTLIVVRKPYEIRGNSHSYQLCEGDRGARTYIILDDFICAGGTVKAIREAIALWAPAMKPIGMLAFQYLKWLDEECLDCGLTPESAKLLTYWI